MEAEEWDRGGGCVIPVGRGVLAGVMRGNTVVDVILAAVEGG